jgi:hypothetical protein
MGESCVKMKRAISILTVLPGLLMAFISMGTSIGAPLSASFSASW